jgi:hypothetical protein
MCTRVPKTDITVTVADILYASLPAYLLEVPFPVMFKRKQERLNGHIIRNIQTSPFLVDRSAFYSPLL